MRKKLTKWGEALGIYFTKSEVEMYGLVEGDVINIEEMLIEKRKKRKK